MDCYGPCKRYKKLVSEPLTKGALFKVQLLALHSNVLTSLGNQENQKDLLIGCKAKMRDLNAKHNG